MWALVSLSLLLPSWASASAAAQDIPSSEAARPRPAHGTERGQAGLFGGFLTAGADGLESGTLFGAGGAFFFSKALGVEAGVHRRSLDLIATPSNELSGGSLDSTTVTGGLIARFPLGSRVVPYVVGGAAYFSNTTEVSPAASEALSRVNFLLTEEVKSGLGFYVGAGLSLLALDRFALFGEARYLGYPADTRAELADRLSGVAAEVQGQQDLNGLEIRLGVRMTFGALSGKGARP